MKTPKIKEKVLKEMFTEDFLSTEHTPETELTVDGIKSAIDLTIDEKNKEAEKIIDEECNKGCGNEFLSEDGDFELLCGKHIWETEGVIKELRLCEHCIERKDELKKKLSRGDD